MIFQVLSYIRHFLKAKSVSKISDESLRVLLGSVLDKDKRYYAFLTLSMLRRKMLKDSRKIQVVDLGAGSKKLDASARIVKDIAKLSVKKAKFAEVLFRLIDNKDIQTTIELGTSLGVTTGYLAMANKNGKVITLEGCQETLKIAAENFNELGIKNIQKVAGDFDDHLPQVLNDNKDVGLVFIDGNHTKEATLRYFKHVIALKSERVIMVFDDIHWSKGMEEAWCEIIADSSVQVSIDLFEMGIVIIDKQYNKGHYVISA